MPTALPSGSSILEITATIARPAPFPMLTMAVASLFASSNLFINAPLPILTSNTMPSAPDASFLLIMLPAINEMLSTVAVTSLRAYSFLSAGARLPVCDAIAILISLTFFINVSSSIAVVKPSNDSNLSIVPPVCPRPLPDILATGTPSAATIGASTNVVLSPTPPVLCLSTLIPLIADKSSISPECAIAIVRLSVSSSVIPLKYIAIKSADT